LRKQIEDAPRELSQRERRGSANPVREPPDGPIEHNSKGVTFWLDRGAAQIVLDYRSEIPPRSTGTITVRSGGVESTASGAFLRFEPTVQIKR
jgi:hypothetical protein